MMEINANDRSERRRTSPSTAAAGRVSARYGRRQQFLELSMNGLCGICVSRLETCQQRALVHWCCANILGMELKSRK